MSTYPPYPPYPAGRTGESAYYLMDGSDEGEE